MEFYQHDKRQQVGAIHIINRKLCVQLTIRNLIYLKQTNQKFNLTNGKKKVVAADSSRARTVHGRTTSLDSLVLMDWHQSHPIHTHFVINVAALLPNKQHQGQDERRRKWSRNRNCSGPSPMQQQLQWCHNQYYQLTRHCQH